MMRWWTLLLLSTASSLLSVALAEPRELYSGDEQYALARGVITALIAVGAHWLDWRKRPHEQRAQTTVLQAGLFWAFLVGGAAGGLMPLLLERLHVELGGFRVWLEYTLSAGLGVSAASIASAIQSGVRGGLKQILRHALGLEAEK